jgi:ABC-type transport system involved in multi-copper enzyme maturation permease subunit
MSRLIWRQHRGELFFLGAGVLLIIVFLAIVRALLAASYAELGIGACDSASTEVCRNALQSFLITYTWLNLVIYALLLTPALLGMFVAAPLVAREVEAGTFRFAWMQSVTRSQWFWAKVLAVTCASALATAAITAAVTWALAPLIRVDELMTLNFMIPMTFPLFDVSGTALVASTALAIAVGTLFGALTKRTVLAMVLSLVVFAAVRIPMNSYVMNSYVRPNLLPPLTLTAPISVNNPLQLVPLGSWLRGTGFIDRQGNTYELLAMVAAPCARNGSDAAAFARCVDDLGLRAYVIYEPPDRFWVYQGVESGAYVTIAAILLLAAWWHVRYGIA